MHSSVLLLCAPQPANIQAKVSDLEAVLTDKLNVAEGELRVTQQELMATRQEVALKTKDLQEMDKEKTKLEVNNLFCFFAKNIFSVCRVVFGDLSLGDTQKKGTYPPLTVLCDASCRSSAKSRATTCRVHMKVQVHPEIFGFVGDCNNPGASAAWHTWRSLCSTNTHARTCIARALQHQVRLCVKPISEETPYICRL